MPRHVEVRPGVYLDSVALMQVSRAASTRSGVRAALVAMATELNLELAVGMGFTLDTKATPTDLVIAIDAADSEALAGALATVDSALTPAPAASGGPGSGSAPRPRTTGSALRGSDAGLALISTPGDYAFIEAMDALEAGRSVMVFSDNVPLEHEIRLKAEAEARGLLVMGPDCGTAVVAGVGLGFANVVRPGPVGIVAASGTGAQHLMCLLDSAGVGISHCLGVGSRDMSAEVGGRSTLAALDLLGRDAATQVIVVVGKPPDAGVAETIGARAAALGKPVLIHLQSTGDGDLTTTAQAVTELAGHSWTQPRSWPASGSTTGSPGYLRGLFSGGTLCEEAMLIAAETVEPIWSNIPLKQEWTLGGGLTAHGHVMVDFGDDELTRGRPHPMIDNTFRVERLVTEAQDPACGVVLLDVVLGHGAHPDPAAELAPAIATARLHAHDHGRELAVVVSLVGTAGDPQGLDRQASALRAAGASVHLSNAQAAREAVALAKEGA